ncbi:uncharacterized protein C5L36_0B01630 [Pichia kudriavzevii]|uniref:Mtf2-like C-terminal domain-containing protein n=1 Tax=Pichia kudriavzevii TaxID=4909 RepID=A0A2U9R1A6_PICKU|nr:uncharacterized protein C5L36_0B01630 [Pichia kudriavzevii]AWU74899.1 hypothetical protein C5L36_0B01630 [Pichia kudriavzevii]
MWKYTRSCRLNRKYSSFTKLGKTFGEIEKDVASNKTESVIDKIKENTLYKSFFQDYEKLKKDSDSGVSRITSFEEQKSFKQVFDYLSKETNKIGVVKSLETFVNFQSPVQQKSGGLRKENKGQASFFQSTSGPINLEKQYEARMKQNKEIIKALTPTLSYINSNINTTIDMSNFVKTKIISVFVDDSGSSKRLSKSLTKKTSQSTKKQKYDIKQITEQSLTSPSNPLVDVQTLPILLKFCLNSLTFDFDSISTSLVLIDYIKKHPSIELYGHGLNIDCYNAILIQVWSKTENLTMITCLLDELKVNAVQPDLYTFKIIAKIYLHFMRVKDGLASEPYILWNNSQDIHKLRDYLRDFRLL